MTSSPLVSICIPTHKRARYLESLLFSLADHFAAMPYSCEIVIADNASPDQTQQVVQAFMDRLPIRYIRHPENIGGFPNVQFVMQQARGRYIVYLADDDSLLIEQVAEAIAKMEADPDIAVLYAPWMLFDLVADQPQGQFYTIPQDLRIERGQHKELLDHLLSHHIFPEVQIVRREVLQRVMPRINEHAFFAFVHAADYLNQGAVLIQQQPFYVAITDYFADDVREQLGNQEVEYAWDRYRGGLDYVLAQAGQQVSPTERSELQARIQQMIAVRMSVAIRLRYLGGKNPVDTHVIALRLRGMGYENLCPVPISQLATEAALYFLLNDTELTRGIGEIVCVGEFDGDLQNFLSRNSPLPLRFLPQPPALDALRDTLVFARNGHQLASSYDGERHLRVVIEKELMARFPK
ncbi:glycosyltransferase family 2 protein [Roseateles violae]|uniref:Glycosyltransferase family 2 protein n=1 Tax=Roseateles violae TaxID=3058042 RepID=A0ABT8DXM2_9BURK|nr:glycosyltransferase family 2 protein [Pelomonas sp. PFR6]MDN3921584.1 glycosyltransferase family 2 protein [Pelomonas sp. PFR6]